MGAKLSAASVYKMKPRLDRAKKVRASVHVVQPRTSCTSCKDDKHSLYICRTYQSMPVEARSTHVKSGLCFNCLGYGHCNHDCRSQSNCKKCARWHHTTLHREYQTAAIPAQNDSPPTSEPAAVNTVVTAGTTPHQANLMTSQVVIEAPTGKRIVARALLDSGASVSLVSSRIVQSLQLPKTYKPIALSGAQGKDTGLSQHIVNFVVSSTQLKLTASVVNKVTCDLPRQDAPQVRDLPHLKELQFADPTFDKPSTVDLLLGCNALQHIVKPEIRKGYSDEPVAISTIFG